MFNDIVADMHEQLGYNEKTAKDMLYTGGYSIYCTVDPEIQSIVESVYADRNNLNYTSSKGQLLQSGATIIDNTTATSSPLRAAWASARAGSCSTIRPLCVSAVLPSSP